MDWYVDRSPLIFESPNGDFSWYVDDMMTALHKTSVADELEITRYSYGFDTVIFVRPLDPEIPNGINIGMCPSSATMPENPPKISVVYVIEDTARTPGRIDEDQLPHWVRSKQLCARSTEFEVESLLCDWLQQSKIRVRDSK